MFSKFLPAISGPSAPIQHGMFKERVRLVWLVADDWSARSSREKVSERNTVLCLLCFSVQRVKPVWASRVLNS